MAPSSVRTSKQPFLGLSGLMDTEIPGRCSGEAETARGHGRRHSPALLRIPSSLAALVLNAPQDLQASIVTHLPLPASGAAVDAAFAALFFAMPCATSRAQRNRSKGVARSVQNPPELCAERQEKRQCHSPHREHGAGCGTCVSLGALRGARARHLAAHRGLDRRGLLRRPLLRRHQGTSGFLGRLARE